jgi:hypothetical protein
LSLFLSSFYQIYFYFLFTNPYFSILLPKLCILFSKTLNLFSYNLVSFLQCLD